VLDPLLDYIDQDPDIEGIIGFSEGAGIAASLIVEETKRQKATGRIPRLKCAVFMSGMPPMDSTSGRYLLQDQDGELISIPTFHIMGSQDAMISGVMALYNVCDPDTADLFDHGGGHIIPRDAQTVTEISKIIRAMVADL
jgi:predicted esterase